MAPSPRPASYTPLLPLKHKGEAEESCLLPYGTGHRVTVTPLPAQGQKAYLVSLHSPKLSEGFLGLVGRGMVMQSPQPLSAGGPSLAQLVEALVFHLLAEHAPEVRPGY